MEPRLRRAAALRSLDRVGEAGQEYEMVVGMDEECQEAREGLRDCRQETGDKNHIELHRNLWLKASKGMELEVPEKVKTRKDQMCSWLFRQEYYR